MRPATARVILMAFVAVTELAHLWWQRADTLPQGWDQAAQLTAAERFRRMPPVVSLVRFPMNPGYYPPLVPWLASVCARIFGNTDDGFTRIMPVFRVLLIVATWRLAGRFVAASGALAAAILLGTAPLVVRDARYLTLDIPLAAMTALAVLLLAESGLRTRAAAVRFGTVAGLGMLVKWTLPIALVAPVVAALRASRAARRHALVAAVVAVAICGTWYLGSFSHLKRELGHAAYRGADIAADRVLSLFSIGFYPLSLPESVGWPMTVAAAAGLIMALRIPAWRRRLWFVAVPLILLILIRNKKERYFAPVYPFLAILAGLAVERVRTRDRRLALTGIIIVCAFQFVSLTFPVPWAFGRACRPQAQDWPLDAMIRRATEEGGGSLAVIPDIQTLNIHMAEFQALRHGAIVRPAGIGEFPGTFDWALVKTGGQGPWHSQPDLRERMTSELLSSSGSGALFTTVARWPLPDGSTARLLRRKPAGLDDAALAAALRRLWVNRFDGNVSIAVSGSGTTRIIHVTGSPLVLRLEAGGTPVPLRFRTLDLRFNGATPYLQPDGTVSLAAGRVIVQQAVLDARDLTAFLVAARPHWKHGDLRLVAKPVRSLLRRLDDPAITIEDESPWLRGNYRGGIRLPAIRLGIDRGRLKWWVAGLRGSLLAIEYPLADRLDVRSVRVVPD